MKRVIETKFYTYNQNNSGGYFVEDEKHGVCETIIIEAENASSAYFKLNEIGKNVDGFWDFCNCCGERWWDENDDDEGTETPTIYGEKIEGMTKDMFREKCFIHYFDGEIKKVVFKNE